LRISTGKIAFPDGKNNYGEVESFQNQSKERYNSYYIAVLKLKTLSSRHNFGGILLPLTESKVLKRNNSKEGTLSKDPRDQFQKSIGSFVASLDSI